MAQRTEPSTPSAGKRRAPEMATQVAGSTHPAIDEYAPFYLVFHPDRWVVINGRLVPSLQKLPLMAGVNGIDVEKGGRIRFAAARTRLEEEGRRVVPWEWAPDGESYLQCLDTRPGGGKEIKETWISVFETANIGARETSPNEDEYAEWLEGLVKSGRLPACPIDTARRMLDKARERWQKSLAEANKNGGAGPAAIRAEMIKAEVEALQAIVDGHKAERAKAKPRRAPTVEDAS